MVPYIHSSAISLVMGRHIIFNIVRYERLQGYVNLSVSFFFNYNNIWQIYHHYSHQ